MRTALVCAAIVLAWLVITWIVYRGQGGDPTRAGPFADMFGAVNALFTGLAFAGVVFTLLSQSKQIKQARLDSAQTAKDEAEMREAFSKATYAAAFKTASDILQASPVRDARRVVITGIGRQPLDRWTPTQLAAAETVCHSYNQAGMLVRYGLLPALYVADGWGDSLRKCWTACGPLVRRYREERNSYEFWGDFEYLAHEAEKYHKKSPTVASIAA